MAIRAPDGANKVKKKGKDQYKKTKAKTNATTSKGTPPRAWKKSV